MKTEDRKDEGEPDHEADWVADVSNAADAQALVE